MLLFPYVAFLAFSRKKLASNFAKFLYPLKATDMKEQRNKQQETSFDLNLEILFVVSRGRRTFNLSLALTSNSLRSPSRFGENGTHHCKILGLPCTCKHPCRGWAPSCRSSTTARTPTPAAVSACSLRSQIWSGRSILSPLRRRVWQCAGLRGLSPTTMPVSPAGALWCSLPSCWPRRLRRWRRRWSCSSTTSRWEGEVTEEEWVYTQNPWLMAGYLKPLEVPGQNNSSPLSHAKMGSCFNFFYFGNCHSDCSFVCLNVMN